MDCTATFQTWQGGPAFAQPCAAPPGVPTGLPYPRGESSSSSGSWGTSWSGEDGGSSASPLGPGLDRAFSAPVHIQAMRVASMTLDNAALLEKASGRGGAGARAMAGRVRLLPRV